MLKLSLILSILAVSAFHVSADVQQQQQQQERRHFNGFKVLRASVSTVEQFQLLSTLRDETNFDFWSGPEMGGFADIMATPEQFESLENILRGNQISYSLMINDVERIVAQEREASKLRSANETGMNWNNYQSLETIYNWLDELESNYSIVSTFEIGRSTENRTLRVLKISTTPSGAVNVSKPAVWVDGTIHAREFISPSTVTYTINQLLTNASRELLDAVDFYFLPVMNPDGYEYSRNVDRLWRKSRSVQANSSCLGVDLNRNFDFHFGEEGSSSDICSITFSGSKPFSDPESAAVRDYVSTIPNLQVFITTHSYSQLFMTPFGWTTDLPDNYDEMLELSDRAVAALARLYGTQYKTGSSANVLYKSAGTSRDWAKGVLNVRYVYTVELRDTGRYGFVLPPDQILPTGEETYAAFSVVFQHVATQN